MHALALLVRAENPVATGRIWPVAVVTVVFAVLGWGVRGVSLSGAVAGAGICLVLSLTTGWGGFAALCTVFLLTWAATRVGYREKQKLGTAEAASGRNAAQVLANLGVAAVCAGWFAYTGDRRLLPAFAAALAEPAADTVSSEIGQTLGIYPRLITSWRMVPPGTDGAITLPGTMAGLVAAIVVACVLAVGQVIRPHDIIVSAAAAFLGCLGDSVLGATLERRGLAGNNAVNLASTMLAALLAFAFSA